VSQEDRDDVRWELDEERADSVSAQAAEAEEEELAESEHVRDLETRRREALRSVEEAGGGEQEGFELAEDELIEHASHGDEHSTNPIFRDASDESDEYDPDVYGEPDEEHKPD
jgi:hypothetical protein